MPVLGHGIVKHNLIHYLHFVWIFQLNKGTKYYPSRRHEKYTFHGCPHNSYSLYPNNYDSLYEGTQYNVD